MSRFVTWAVGLLPIDSIETVVGHLMVVSARKRIRRADGLDDAHEVRHLYAALLSGNSSDCDYGRDCVLDRLP